MSKKKSRKKHQFKYAAPVGSSAVSMGGESSLVATRSTTQPAVLLSSDGELTHIRHDIIKTAYLAAAFICGQLVLWALFNHTGVGAAVYSLVKL